MKIALRLILLLLTINAQAQIGRVRNGLINVQQPPFPDTVSVLGRLENSTAGTSVTSTIADNGFVGDTDGTWSFVTVAGSTWPQVQTTQTIFEDGVQISGGTGLGDSGSTRYYMFVNDGADRYPKYTFTVVKSTVVWGFNLVVSNFTGGSGLYANIFQVGVSPYQRISFSANQDEFGGCVTCYGIATHTGLGTGTYINITNMIPYRIVGKFDGAGNSTELKIYAIAGPGSYVLIGTSTRAGDGAGTANEIRLTNEDDHDDITNGVWRQDNYMWSYTASDYPAGMLPNF
jgi:hypothetical protein